MGEALVRGILAKKIVPANEILISDPLAKRREYLASEFGVQVTSDNLACLQAQLVILAVKPNNLKAVLTRLGNNWPAETTLVSILAGITLDQIAHFLPEAAPIIRVMPNTPSLIGMGMSGLVANAHTTNDQKFLAIQLFEAVGDVVEVPEEYFDAVTGLSGSGPAYVFLMIEALIEAGVYQGLPRRIARQLVLQTIIGASSMVKETGKHPADLKEQVTSPGGTTASGLGVLEAAALRSILIQAVDAATQKSKALSGG